MEQRLSVRSANNPAVRISAEEAAALVRSDMWLDFGGGLCQPDAFDRALSSRVGEVSNVKIRSCLTLKPRASLEADPQGKSFHLFSWHFSGYDRKKHDAGQCHYVPINLGEVSDYYRRFVEPVDILVLKTCPEDENGFFNFGPSNLWHRATIERARTVIVETSASLPRAYGMQNGVHISEVDFIIEPDDAPQPQLMNPPPTEVDHAVARLIEAEIEDGNCLQIGIGAMPNAVCSLLLESGERDLGIHTEMLTDGIIHLYKAGAVTGARKRLDPGKVVYTFALGSDTLYRAIDRNDDIVCYPSEYTNAPHVIMQNDDVRSINNTTQIDLQGQAASESDGHRHISGTGGQLQFVRGAYASKGGKSFICLSSTYEKHGVRKSRIVPDLTCGNIVTTPRTDVMYVVTEYGMVNLKGKSVCERAKAMISIAHPDFREELERAAYDNRLTPRGVSFN